MINLVKIFLLFTICTSSFLLKHHRILNIGIWRGKKIVNKIHKSHPDCASNVIDLVGFSVPFVLIGSSLHDK